MKTQISITKNNGAVEIIAPYSTENNDKFRQRGGKYDRERGWVFAPCPAVSELVEELWGAESPVVTVAIKPEQCQGSQTLQIGGYVVASRRGRDYRVELPEGVVVYEGRFLSSGGSVKNPCVTWESGTVLHANVRQSFAQRHGLEIVSDGKQEPAAVNPLAQYSDAELLAEIKRRGL